MFQLVNKQETTKRFLEGNFQFPWPLRGKHHWFILYWSRLLGFVPSLPIVCIILFFIFKGFFSKPNLMNVVSSHHQQHLNQSLPTMTYPSLLSFMQAETVAHLHLAGKPSLITSKTRQNLPTTTQKFNQQKQITLVNNGNT